MIVRLLPAWETALSGSAAGRQLPAAGKAGDGQRADCGCLQLGIGTVREIGETTAMIETTLQQVQLEQLSSIRHEVHIGNSSAASDLGIMVLKFAGSYGYGSEGNCDAIYMRAIGNACVDAWEPGGLIIDLSGLAYEWGDRLEMVFGIGNRQYEEMPFPVALVVGEQCCEGIRTLLLGLNSPLPVTEAGWVFTELEQAWVYIEAEIHKFRRLQLL